MCHFLYAFMNSAFYLHYVFMSIAFNSDYFPKQDQPPRLCNGDELCCL